MLRIAAGAAILYEQQSRGGASGEIEAHISELHYKVHIRFLGIRRCLVAHVRREPRRAPDRSPRGHQSRRHLRAPIHQFVPARCTVQTVRWAWRNAARRDRLAGNWGERVFRRVEHSMTPPCALAGAVHMSHAMSRIVGGLHSLRMKVCTERTCGAARIERTHPGTRPGTGAAASSKSQPIYFDSGAAADTSRRASRTVDRGTELDAPTREQGVITRG